MIVYYSEYSMFVVGDYVPKWLPKWASQLKTIMSDLRLRNGNFPFRNRKGCELGLYNSTWYVQFRTISAWISNSHRHGGGRSELSGHTRNGYFG